MRLTLPLRLVPRTPACPGFCVFGHRKSACFDRSCCRGAISPEPRLPALPHGWDRGDTDGTTHRERAPGRGFERVQMSVPGRQISEAFNGRPGSLSFERVQMDWGSGVLSPWQPCPLGSFERVQIAPAFALRVARAPAVHRGSRRQSHRAPASQSAFSAPANERHFPVQLITGERPGHP
jgi:hypothetical protein